MTELVAVQERGAVLGLADVFPQDEQPFPTAVIERRWREELADAGIAAYVAVDADERVVGFCARRDDEVLHFGTAPETWGSGLATWMHDALLETFPADLARLRLRVFEGNGRGRRFYEKLGWRATGEVSRSTFAPYPVLLEYAVDRADRAGAG